MALPTNWVNNIGMQVDSAFLNQLGEEVNANTAAVTALNSRLGGEFVAPPSSGWTAVNMQTGASWAQDGNDMLLTIPSVGSADNWQYQYRAYPTPPFTLTAYIDHTFNKSGTASPNASSGAHGGIVISDGTKLITFGPSFVNASTGGWSGTGAYVAALKWTNATTFSAAFEQSLASWIGGLPKWYRVVDDGTNLALMYSFNGVDWKTATSAARTAFLTPTRIGVAGSSAAGGPSLLRVRSWSGVA